MCLMRRISDDDILNNKGKYLLVYISESRREDGTLFVKSFEEHKWH